VTAESKAIEDVLAERRRQLASEVFRRSTTTNTGTAS